MNNSDLWLVSSAYFVKFWNIEKFCNIFDETFVNILHDSSHFPKLFVQKT